MEESELKERLMEYARLGGICAPGYERMRSCDRNGLIDYYVCNPDWCLEREFPSLEFLKREFRDIEEKGVFVGKSFDGEVFDGLQTYIFHDCKGMIRVAMDYGKAVIPMLYFANGCDMRIVCEQGNDPAIVVPLYIAERMEERAGNTAPEHKQKEVQGLNSEDETETSEPGQKGVEDFGLNAGSEQRIIAENTEGCVFRRHIIKIIRE